MSKITTTFSFPWNMHIPPTWKTKSQCFTLKKQQKDVQVFLFKKLFCVVRQLSTMELPSLIYDHFLYLERSSPNTQIFNNIKYHAGLTYVLFESMPSTLGKMCFYKWEPSNSDLPRKAPECTLWANWSCTWVELDSWFFHGSSALLVRFVRLWGRESAFRCR